MIFRIKTSVIMMVTFQSLHNYTQLTKQEYKTNVKRSVLFQKRAIYKYSTRKSLNTSYTRKRFNMQVYNYICQKCMVINRQWIQNIRLIFFPLQIKYIYIHVHVYLYSILKTNLLLGLGCVNQNIIVYPTYLSTKKLNCQNRFLVLSSNMSLFLLKLQLVSWHHSF